MSEPKDDVPISDEIEKVTKSEDVTDEQSNNSKSKKTQKEKPGLLDRYARSIVLHPWRHFLAIWGIIGGAIIVVFALGWFDIKTFTADDWTIATGSGSIRQDSYDWAVEHSDTSKAFAGLPRPYRTEGVFLASALFMYEWKDRSRTDDIFTPPVLQAICEIERVFLTNPNFNKVCLTQDAQGEDTVCDYFNMPILTPYFYQTPELYSSCPLLDQGTITFIRNSFALDPSGSGLFFFDRALLEDNTLPSPRTRSSVTFGGPLGPDTTGGASFSTVADTDGDPQWPFYEEFLGELQGDLESELDLQGGLIRSKYYSKVFVASETVEVRYYSYQMDNNELDDLVIADTALVAISMVCVGLCMYFHVRSFFVTAVGLSAVLAGIPFGLFLYRGIFQIDYFNQVHVTIIFLILGVGADNVFVFSDSWRQSYHLWYDVHGISSTKEAEELNLFRTGKGELEVLMYRMAYSIQLSATSTFNTTLTTVAAFLATGVSPVVPVAAFGFFAALVVLANYFWVFLVYPPTMMLHHFYFEGRSCTGKPVAEHPQDAEEIKEVENALEAETGKPAVLSERDEQERLELLEEQNSSSIETKFFTKFYIPLMTKRMSVCGKKIYCSAYISLFVCLLAFVGLAYQASHLQVPNSIEGNYQPGHMFGEFREDFSKNYAGGAEEEFAPIIFTFGIKGMNRDGMKRFEPNGFRGVAIFDESFDISPSENQLHYLDVCEGLRELSCIPAGDTKPLFGCTDKVTGLLTFPDKVDCVLEDFYQYSEDNFNLTRDDLLEIGDNDPELFYDYLETFSLEVDNTDHLGFFGDKLKFISIEFVATLKQNRPTREKEPVFNLLYAFEDRMSARANKGMQTTMMTNFDMLFIDTEKGIVSGLFSGLGVSLPTAYAVLLVGTNNLVLATFAFFSIVGIVCCVLGTVYSLGWTLGIAEAIAAIMVVGLSVDYSVHIGHMYAVAGEEGHPLRKDRFEISAKRMGPTVLAGFVTTALAAVWMLLCQLAFFPKMGTLIILTVTFSIIFALGFYLPLCLLVGPQGHYGEIVRFFRWVVGKPLDSHKHGEKRPEPEESIPVKDTV